MPEPTSPTRVLVIAHGHPELNKGGGEIAAYNLFKTLDTRADYKALFLARQSNSSANHGGTPFSSRADKELLFCSEGFELFKFVQPNKRFLWANFRELIETFKPDIVHFHHYLHISIDAIRVIKNVDPAIRIVLTLHEFLAICHNSGQMVKTNRRLCYKATPADCHQCFPTESPQNFFLRELYIKSFFRLVDQFIAPSQFLKDRYVAWGLSAETITVLENGQPPVTAVTAEKRATVGRFAYFGQLTQFKGLDVLLEAIAMLPKATRKQLRLDIHGTGLEIQPPEFQTKVLGLMRKLSDCVTFHGAYEGHELNLLMKDIDWVVVPSVWWENSPLVIQEAFNHGKPVICSDIGGMAEKVRDGIDGLHFRTGKASSLAELIASVAFDPALHAKLAKGILKPPTLEESAAAHDRIYRSLLSPVSGAALPKTPASVPSVP